MHLLVFAIAVIAKNNRIRIAYARLYRERIKADYNAKARLGRLEALSSVRMSATILKLLKVADVKKTAATFERFTFPTWRLTASEGA